MLAEIIQLTFFGRADVVKQVSSINAKSRTLPDQKTVYNFYIFLQEVTIN